MRRLWYFNPENDMALAAGRAAYTPPIAAVWLRRSGAVLPLWMASPGDMILCGGVNDAWLAERRDTFGLGAEPWDGSSDVSPVPWGWSLYTRGVLARAGVPRSTMPTDAALDALRELSHRRTAADLRQAVASRIDFGIWPGATEIRSAADAADYIAAHDGCVLKLPWSSSGRGISFVDAGAVVPAHVSGDIRRYGSVMAEPLARRVADFAMLYNICGGEARYCGLSVFKTDSRGAYVGNVVAPQAALEARLGRLYPPARLEAVRRAVGKALAEICDGLYDGPAGVDMLLARDADGSTVLHAAVEINFRCTMGFVALALARYVAGEAVFAVERGDTADACRYQASDGRLVSGRLALTPPGGDFTFVLTAQ